MTKGTITYINHTGSDILIAKKARASYGQSAAIKTIEEDIRLCVFLGIENHTSPLRHFHVETLVNMALDVMAQFRTHCVGMSYNSQSMRYTAANEFDTVELREAKKGKQVSGDVINDDRLNKIVTDTIANTYLAYRNLLDNGVAAESAGRFLPRCTMTNVAVTGSVQAWLNFLALRSTPEAQKEIRHLAHQMRAIMREHYPATMVIFEAVEQERQEMIKRLRGKKTDIFEAAMKYYGGAE